jgi:hypothetical protein
MKRVLSWTAMAALVSLFGTIMASAIPGMQADDWNNQATRQEIQDFRQFLDTHTWIANKLRQNPSLANKQDFLNGNPPLPKFLNAHPFVESGLKSDPKGFMRQVEEFTASPQQPTGQDWRRSRRPARSTEMRDFRQFLSDHTYLAQQLQNDPALANNPDFLNSNPDFAQFLRSHPFVQRSIRANATEVIRQAQQDYGSAQEPSGGSWNSRNNQANDQEMSDFQQFLADHPWIAGKLRGNPSLANSQDFLNGNPPLPKFLNAHPYVQSQFKADPNGFMQRARDFASGAGQTAYSADAHGADIATLHQFMLNHPWIGKKLRDNPKVANDDDFLNNNPELKDFLGAHPYLQQQFKQDPGGLMQRERGLGGQF